MKRLWMTGLVGAVLLSLASGAWAHHITVGYIASRPAGRFVGAWTLGTQAVQVTGRTEIYQEHGQLEIGNCALALVEVNPQTGVVTGNAVKLWTKPDSYCNE